jgi:tetratricopeptide (TPR) repeat protein
VASVGIKPQPETQDSNNFLSTDSPKRTLLLSLVLVVIVVAVYVQVRDHTFCGLDDYLYVVDNAHVHEGLSWKTVVWAFSCFTMANWIPLSFLSHALDYQLFGLEPAGHHLVNVMFHAVDVVLLFLVLKRATGYVGRSFMVAALFALHPMNVEPVVWVAERKTMLSMLFFLLALGAYQWYVQEPRISRFRWVTILFALGLLAKPQIITLPFVLLLWDYWPLQRTPPLEAKGSPIWGRIKTNIRNFSGLLKEKGPLLILCVMGAMIALATQKSARLQYQPPLSLRLENAIYSYFRYVENAFWPSNMAPEYPMPGSLTVWQIGGALLFLLAVSAFVVAARKYRYLPVGWFWFLGTLVPTIGLVQVGRQALADRYAYEAYLGLFIMVCWGVADWAEQHHLRVSWLAGASAIVLLALALVTYRQIGYWKDDLTLWTHATEVVPNHWTAETNIGVQLLKQDKAAEAMAHFRRAISFYPYEAISNMEVGYVEQTRGDYRAAIANYEHALGDFNLTDAEAAQIWRNMGVCYRELGDLDKARECFANEASLSAK